MSDQPVPIFPLLNACLNACATVLLIWGYVLVKKRKLDAHKKVMLAAFVISAVFLISYLWYHFNYPAVKFQGQGLWRYLYFGVLIPHIILAAAMVPFILRLLYLAWKQQMRKHAKLARWVWPVWIYVSITGVVVYWMLYEMKWSHP